jgi:DNA polymerase-3 subunit gamma/tau
MRDALSIMDQAIASAPVINGQAALDAAQIRELMGSVPNSVFERLLEAIGENQSAPVIAEINRLLNAGNSASQLARQFVRYLRNVLMARIAGEQTELLQLSPDERARAGRSALLFSEEDLTRFLSVMLRTFDELNYRQEPRFHLELGLLKLVHLQRLLPVEQLLSQLGGAAPRLGGGPLPSHGSPKPSSPSRVSPAPVAAPPTPREPSATTQPTPAFSPFEQDRRRKGSEPSTPATPTVSSQVNEPEPVAEEPTTSEPTHQPDEPEAIAVSPEVAAPALVPSELATAPTLDAIRDRVCDALEQAQLNTAATLLQNGAWSEEGDSILVQVGVKKTMLGLTINPEAEKVCREAIRSLLGKPRPLTFVPGEAGAAPPPSARRPASTGSVQARAMEHPLVRQAQELFQAEVRSVVDLRSK